MSNQEWKHDLPGFQVTVTSSDQNVSMKAINSATGTQYGPRQVFPGINSSVVTGCLQNNLSISEVTDNIIRVQTNLSNDPVELAVQQTLPIEKEHNLLKIEVKNLKDQVRIQELELNELRPLKQQKTFYLTADNWESEHFGLHIYVDFAHLNLQNRPSVLVSINGPSNHWFLTGVNNILNLTPRGFDMFIRSEKGALSAQEARERGWYVNYVVHSMD